MQTISPFTDALAEMHWTKRIEVLLGMVNEIHHGRDETLRALHDEAVSLGIDIIIVGGIAVIQYGYRRTTDDRDILVSYKNAKRFGEHLWDHPDWERLEIREYAFVYKPTGMSVDFLVGMDLMSLGQPYCFPEPSEVEQGERFEDIPMIGLHDLLFLKVVAGRPKDQVDVMELVKLHLPEIEPERILSKLDSSDDERREFFLKVMRDAPKELEGERRLGQEKTLKSPGYRPKRNTQPPAAPEDQPPQD